MRLHRFIFLSVITSLLLLCSCKKDASFYYDFTQYTSTDATGNLIGQTDSTDWGYDNTWTSAESKLLSFKDTLVINDTATGYIHLSSAFPNPSGGTFFIGVDTERECKMKAVFVNEQFQILHYLSRKFTGGPILTVHDFSGYTSFHKGKNYRMYYGFYNSKDSLYYKGHGDLRIE
jgi:hypothetical protein